MQGRLVFRKAVLFIIALFINSFGIAFITKATLGTSPVTSINYVLSMFTPLTMGQWTIIVNILFILFELPFMTRKYLKEDAFCYLMQIPVSMGFGTFIDFSMNMLSWLAPEHYIMKLVSLVTGCFILALGIGLEVKANFAMLAGEYFVRAISRRIKGEFGFVKLWFDISLVVLSCAVSLIFMSSIKGIREGTVAAAVLVGPIVHFIKPLFGVLDGWLHEKQTSAVSGNIASSAVPGHIVITIAREFGSGGHILAEALSKTLGLKLYNKELIEMAAKESGMSEKFITENEQTMSRSRIEEIVFGNFEAPLEYSLSSKDALFVAQSRIIRQIAGKESCIILGRCGDYILKDYPGLLKIFCYSDPGSALERATEEYGLNPDTAASEIRKMNQSRISHYEYYTGHKWGEPHNYDLMINTGSMDFTTACRLVKDLYDRKLSGTEGKHQA